MSFLINLPCYNNNMHRTNTMDVQNNIQTNTVLNVHDVAKDFCNIYYASIITKGFQGVLYLFNQDAICDYNGKSMNGIYNLMTYFCSLEVP